MLLYLPISFAGPSYVEIYKHVRTQEKCLEKHKPGTSASHSVIS
jgi:hypothetical protein